MYAIRSYYDGVLFTSIPFKLNPLFIILNPRIKTRKALILSMFFCFFTEKKDPIVPNNSIKGIVPALKRNIENAPFIILPVDKAYNCID